MALRSAHHGRRHDRTGQYRGQRRRWRRVQPANSDIPPQTEPPTSANLTNWLNAFYAAEQKRKTPFPDQLPADAQPFDLLVINICSLSGRILKPPV